MRSEIEFFSFQPIVYKQESVEDGQKKYAALVKLRW
jgi:hypothetical protein